jgi:hypothetical protein
MDSAKKVEVVLLQLMAGGKTLRPTRLIDRLAATTGLARLEVRGALAELAGDGKVSGVTRSGEPLKMVAWTGAPEFLINSAARQFEDVLKSYPDLAELPALASLLSHADLFDGLSADDVANVVRGLLQCRQAEQLGQDPIFTSAAHILGSAKALKNLRRATRSLGGAGIDDQGSELYALTAGPSQPKAIVLIENIRSFTAFARSPHALEVIGVAAYGYGLTMENFGARLAANQVVACPAYGEAVNLKVAISRLPIFFWGDLDREGLRIFESLREQLPSLALSAAYEAMERRCSNPTLCHPYHRLFEKEGQRLPRGSTPETAHLAQRCSERAVDQEALGFELGDLNIAAPYRIQNIPEQDAAPGGQSVLVGL